MLDEEDVSMVYLLGGGEEYNYLPRYRAYLQYLDLREVNPAAHPACACPFVLYMGADVTCWQIVAPLLQ